MSTAFDGVLVCQGLIKVGEICLRTEELFAQFPLARIQSVLKGSIAIAFGSERGGERLRFEQ